MMPRSLSQTKRTHLSSIAITSPLLLLLCLLVITPVQAQSQKNVKARKNAPIGKKSKKTPLEATFIPALTQEPFAIRTADGSSFLRVGGLLQTDMYAFLGNSGRTGNSGFLLRRARPILNGSLLHLVDFRLMPDFAQGTTVLQDGFLDLHLHSRLILRTGKTKVPYSLERLQAAQDVIFVERSLAGNLIPIRDVGAVLAHSPEGTGLEWQFGVFNGVVDNASADGNSDNNFDLAARVFYQPFRGIPHHGIQGLGFGVASTIGNEKESLAAVTLRTAGRSSFFKYADGVTADGKRQRIAPQFYLYAGSFGLLGEYYDTRERLRKANIAESVSLSGLNIQASYILTGEKTSFRNPIPRHPYDPLTGHGGAYEVAVRYSRFRADSGLFDNGFANRTNAAEKADAYTIGFNVYLNRQCKALFTYEHTRFGSPLTFAPGVVKQENILQTQLQLQF